jgi:hypothetical protein
MSQGDYYNERMFLIFLFFYDPMVASVVTCCTVLLPSLIVRNLQGLIFAPIFIAH